VNASEFPCIEAIRCFVSEKEMGMGRLTMKTLYNALGNRHVATFTKEQSLREEWYLHLDLARSDEEGQGDLRRVLRLQHRGTGQYLSCDEKGRVSCISTPSDSTWWWMQRVDADTGKNGMSSSPASLSDPTKSASDELYTEGQYILSSKQHPLRRLSFAKNVKGFNGSDEELMLIASKNISVAPSLWSLKITSGELCFMVNPVVHHQLRCNMLGQLSLNSRSNGWEVFRFVEAGNGDLYISSWLYYTKFLSSNSDGEISTTDIESRSPGHAERWRVEVPPQGNGLYFQNVASRRYLSVGRKRSEHLWTTTKPNDYALWHVDASHSHIYYMTSLFDSAKAEKQSDNETTTEIATDSYQRYYTEGADDTHLSSSKEGPFLSTKKYNEEEWKVEVTPEGFFTFYSVSHETYLGCNSTGGVHTTTSKGVWSLWDKHVQPHGGVAFMSKEHLRYLAVSETGELLCTTDGNDETSMRHSWRMDPRLPRTISGGTGGYLANTLGLTIAATMPFAVLGAIEAEAGLVPNDSKVESSKLSEETNISKEDHLVAQRPISAWKSWVKFDSNAPPSSALPPSSPSSSPSSPLPSSSPSKSTTKFYM